MIIFFQAKIQLQEIVGIGRGWRAVRGLVQVQFFSILEVSDRINRRYSSDTGQKYLTIIGPVQVPLLLHLLHPENLLQPL